MTRKRFLRTAALLAVVVVVLVATIRIGLPVYLEARVIPGLARDLGLPPLSCAVRRIGLSGMEMGRLQLGEAGGELTATADSVRVNYTLAGLRRRRVDGVHCVGLKVHWMRPAGGPALRATVAEVLLDPGADPAASWTARLAGVRLQSPLLVDLPSVEAILRPRGRPATGADFVIAAPRVTAAADAIHFAGSNATVRGSVDAVAGSALREVRAAATLEDGTVVAAAAGVVARGLHATLPFAWPPPANGAPGEIVVSTVEWRGVDFGPVTAVVTQVERGMELSAHYRPGPGFEVAGIGIDGALDLRGVLRAGETGAVRRVDVALRDMTVTDDRRNLVVRGLEASLSVPDLGQLRSGPEQPLSFAEASIGNVVVTSGKVAYQFEPNGVLFIERAAFDWCGGHVQIAAVRVRPGKADYDIVLHCDRLKLAELLNQFGSFDIEGEGTLNGRVPIEMRNGGFRFVDGFLYSTPGDGGRIRLAQAGVLTAGVSPDTPEYAQLELAGEALKDYSYDWARLQLLTEGDDLALRLQLDGKPANPLPFVYKEDLGRFVRVESSAEGSRFQGIRLDVNLRAPLEKILQRGKSVGDMLKSL